MNIKHFLVGVALAVTGGVALATTTPTTTHAAAIPDVSEWQGKLTASQVRRMKNQVSFVINRRQYGSNYVDKYAANNTALYVKYGVKFGEYDYSTFSSVAGAKREAKLFYQRSNKKALFYVLDYEENDSGSSSSSYTNKLVNAWYTQMRKLTKKKLIFYSYSSFATTYANTARKKFNAQWIASYGSKPTISYALWQYTDSYYLSSLGLSLDNSKVNSSVHKLSWWSSSSSSSSSSKNSSSSKKSSTTTAASDYQLGQTVKLKSTATNYYDRSKISSSVKNKNYVILSTKSISKSHSKQAVFVAGLNKWILSQDVTGVKPAEYSKYEKGQMGYLRGTAVKYYTRQKIASSAKKKGYKITKVKSVSMSRSKQAVYLSGLNKWVLSQDITGMINSNYKYYIVKSKQYTFTNKNLTTTNGKSISANKEFTASLVKTSNNVTRLKTSKGYITSDVRYVEPKYYTTKGTKHYLTVKSGKTVYSYNSTTFKKSTRAEKLSANTKYKVTAVVKRSNGRYYFKLANGYYVTADKLQVVLH